MDRGRHPRLTRVLRARWGPRSAVVKIEQTAAAATPAPPAPQAKPAPVRPRPAAPDREAEAAVKRRASALVRRDVETAADRCSRPPSASTLLTGTTPAWVWRWRAWPRGAMPTRWRRRPGRARARAGECARLPLSRVGRPEGPREAADEDALAARRVAFLPPRSLRTAVWRDKIPKAERASGRPPARTRSLPLPTSTCASTEARTTRWPTAGSGDFLRGPGASLAEGCTGTHARAADHGVALPVARQPSAVTQTRCADVAGLFLAQEDPARAPGRAVAPETRRRGAVARARAGPRRRPCQDAREPLRAGCRRAWRSGPRAATPPPPTAASERRRLGEGEPARWRRRPASPIPRLLPRPLP